MEKKNISSFSQLPNELLQQIFSNLDVLSLEQVLRVSHKFRSNGFESLKKYLLTNFKQSHSLKKAFELKLLYRHLFNILQLSGCVFDFYNLFTAIDLDLPNLVLYILESNRDILQTQKQTNLSKTEYTIFASIPLAKAIGKPKILEIFLQRHMDLGSAFNLGKYLMHIIHCAYISDLELLLKYKMFDYLKPQTYFVNYALIRSMEYGSNKNTFLEMALLLRSYGFA